MTVLVAAEPVKRRLELALPPPPELPGARLLPTEQLLAILPYYRRHGVAFNRAWDEALRLVRWPSSRRDASDWRRAVEDTRQGWWAAYMRLDPESREVAAGQLMRALSA